jgi:ABC-type multidrug transport system permease subunit
MRSDAVYPLLYFAGGAAVYLTPALIGIFWGAPLVTRELEAGTLRLTWNQSVTRTRWMAAKLALIGLVAMATAGLLSLMVTWWSGPIDQAGGFPVTMGQLSRFSPLVFDARGFAPVGYAASPSPSASPSACSPGAPCPPWPSPWPASPSSSWAGPR